MSRYVIDSSAFMEYLAGTQKGLKVQNIMEENTTLISVIGIAEMAYFHEREGSSFSTIFRFIKAHMTVVPMTTVIALRAGKLKKEYRTSRNKFGLADGVHLATAQVQEAILVTTDADFSGCKDALLL